MAQTPEEIKAAIAALEDFASSYRAYWGVLDDDGNIPPSSGTDEGRSAIHKQLPRAASIMKAAGTEGFAVNPPPAVGGPSRVGLIACAFADDEPQFSIGGGPPIYEMVLDRVALTFGVLGDQLAAVESQAEKPAADRETFEAASALLQHMIARVTGGGEVDKRAYKRAREIIMRDESAAQLAPECVRICREPDAVWSYVKGQDPELPSYDSRRKFLRDEYEPLLSALEHFEPSPLDELVTAEAEKLDSASVAAAWRKALERRTSDPHGAVTAARSLLESTCKTILDDRFAQYNKGDDLPKLYRQAAEALRLAPSDHTEQQFKAILGACATIVRELGSVRNRVSDSHGSGRKVYRLGERHAALAVNLAGSMALFLMQTHEARSEDE